MPGLFLNRLACCPVVLRKETVGSPEFPSFPCERMPRPKTPVVSHSLALVFLSRPGLLPSKPSEAVGFPRFPGIILTDHNYTRFRGSTTQPTFSRTSQL